MRYLFSYSFGFQKSHQICTPNCPLSRSKCHQMTLHLFCIFSNYPTFTQCHICIKHWICHITTKVISFCIFFSLLVKFYRPNKIWFPFFQRCHSFDCLLRYSTDIYLRTYVSHLLQNLCCIPLLLCHFVICHNDIYSKYDLFWTAKISGCHYLFFMKNLIYPLIIHILFFYKETNYAEQFFLKLKHRFERFFIISRRALAREGDYEMMPVCACVRACVRVLVSHADSSKTTTATDFW